MNLDLGTFGGRVRQIKAAANALCTDAHLARVYVSDTAGAPGEADYDLLHTAHCLELAAQELRQLHARIEQMRADQTNPLLIAAE